MQQARKKRGEESACARRRRLASFSCRHARPMLMRARCSGKRRAFSFNEVYGRAVRSGVKRRNMRSPPDPARFCAPENRCLERYFSAATRQCAACQRPPSFVYARFSVMQVRQ